MVFVVIIRNLGFPVTSENAYRVEIITLDKEPFGGSARLRAVAADRLEVPLMDVAGCVSLDAWNTIHSKVVRLH